VDRYSFIAVDLHHLLLAGLPAHPCENAQGSTSRRIIFSIALSRIAATALFLFGRAKSRRTFYAQIKRLCFHTAWTHFGHYGLLVKSRLLQRDNGTFEPHTDKDAADKSRSMC
jgi:hypothetical protein